MTPAPAWIASDPEACAAFTRIQTRLRARGEWHPEYAMALVIVASGCACYLRFARALRTPPLRDADPQTLRELEQHLDDYRRHTREALVELWVIPTERAHISTVDAEGLDADIVALCA